MEDPASTSPAGASVKLSESTRSRIRSLAKRARWLRRYIYIRAVAACGIVVATCSFGLLGKKRARRWSYRASILSTSAVPPTPADVVGNYLRGQIVFGHSLTPQMPFRWRSVEVRAVITAPNAEVPKRIRRLQRISDLEIRFDGDYDAIVEGCCRGRKGWLTGDVIELYRQLDKIGLVATVGAYRDGEVVAGLWGVEIGETLGIMSAFHTEDHSGTIVVAAAVDRLLEGGRWSIIDTGAPLENYARFGAVTISREEFCDLVVRHLVAVPPRRDT